MSKSSICAGVDVHGEESPGQEGGNLAAEARVWIFQPWGDVSPDGALRQWENHTSR